jgi:hypothetical protein
VEWFQRADRLRQELKQRNATIARQEDQLFHSLADELRRHVETVKARPEFSAMTIDCQAELVIVAFPVDRSSAAVGLPRQAAVSLFREAHEIVADISGDDGPDSQESFQLYVRQDGSVALKRKDVYLPLPEVATYILWPLFYPEIGPYPGPLKQHIRSVKIPGL